MAWRTCQERTICYTDSQWEAAIDGADVRFSELGIVDVPRPESAPSAMRVD